MGAENKIPIIAAIFLFAALFVLRVPSYNNRMIDWDESIYLLEGDNILHGGIPYREIWDNKGALLYFLFACIIKITGHSIIGMHLFTAGWVGISAFFIFLIGRKLSDNVCGFIGSLFFIVATSNARLDGLESNAEIFFILPVILAVYNLLFFKLDQWRIFLCGFLCGLAFNIKSISVFDAIPVLLAVIAVEMNEEKGLFNTLKSIVIFCTAFLFPLGLIMVYFQYNGFLNQFLTTYFIEPYRYISFRPNLSLSVHLLLRYLHLVFFAIPVIFILGGIAAIRYAPGIYGMNKKETFLSVWLLSVFLGIMIHHQFWLHVTIQAFPPLCLLSAVAVRQVLAYFRKGIFLFIVISLLISGTIISVIGNLVYLKNMFLTGNLRLNDASFLASDYLKRHLTAADYIYVVNSMPTIYFLTGAKIPTRYPFPAVFENPLLYGSLKIDVAAQVRKIMHSNPTYVIYINARPPRRLSEAVLNIINDYLKQNYFLEKNIYTLEIYRYKYRPRPLKRVNSFGIR